MPLIPLLLMCILLAMVIVRSGCGVPASAYATHLLAIAHAVIRSASLAGVVRWPRQIAWSIG